MFKEFGTKSRMLMLTLLPASLLTVALGLTTPQLFTAGSLQQSCIAAGLVLLVVVRNVGRYDYALHTECRVVTLYDETRIRPLALSAMLYDAGNNFVDLNAIQHVDDVDALLQRREVEGLQFAASAVCDATGFLRYVLVVIENRTERFKRRVIPAGLAADQDDAMHSEIGFDVSNQLFYIGCALADRADHAQALH